MRNIIISYLLIYFSCLITPASATELTAAGFMTGIKAVGPRAVIERLWNSDENHPNDWDRLIDKIESGEKGWLDVAKALKPASDAGASEDLSGAVAVALLKNPIDVLTMAQQGPFTVDNVCTCPYVVETPDGQKVADNYLNEAEKALVAMKPPADNPELNTVRRNCLAIIQGMRRGEFKRSWEERSSPDERRSALEQDPEFQSLLNSIEAGTDESLDTFKEMHPITDPMKKGYLERAVARALPNNPHGVLTLVEKGYIGVPVACAAPYLDSQLAMQHLNRSEKALKECSAPRTDKALATIREICLNQIQSSMKSIQKH